MGNRDTRAANSYHQATKLSYINLGAKPPIYKSYAGAPQASLPTDFDPPGCPTLQAVAGVRASGLDDHHGTEPLDITSLARLLHFSAGVVRRGVLPRSGEIHYRAAASAGALYPVEVYLVAGDIPGLKAGVYHFSPAEASLALLREGDHRRELAEAAGGEERVATARVTLALSAVFWRCAWKYRERGYRYCHWDAGTMLSNALAVAAGTGLPIGVVTGFHDGRVNRLLGLTPKREAVLCLAPVGTGSEVSAAGLLPDAPLLAVPAEDSAGSEISYPEIVSTHAATCLTSADQVTAWRSAENTLAHPATVEAVGELEAAGDLTSEPIGLTILKRGSTRRFERGAIPYSRFAAILDAATRRIPVDFGDQAPGTLVDAYIIANAVEGLEAGGVLLLARGAEAGTAEGGGLSRRGRTPVLRAGPGRRLQRCDLLPGLAGAGAGPVWEPGIPGGAVGGRRQDWQRLPVCSFDGAGRNGDDLLR